MQRQNNVLNLFVEFRFQLFNMKTLFYFELRVSAGMIENLKTRDITLIPTAFRSTKMFKNVGIFVPKEMLINTCVEMPIGFTNITSSTARTRKLTETTRDLRESGIKSLGLNKLSTLVCRYISKFICCCLQGVLSLFFPLFLFLFYHFIG